MAVKKIQTGVFTRGGKRVTDTPEIKYPQPGTYDIIGQPSGIYDINVGNTGQDLGVTDTTCLLYTSPSPRD